MKRLFIILAGSIPRSTPGHFTTAGEIEVRMPESAVRSVEARAGVGEARLWRDGETLSPRRHLVGGQVEWESGPGDAAVLLHVGAGEVAVRLE